MSLLKSWYGDAAQADNEFRYSWLPKPGKNSSWLTIHDEARSGNLDGLFAAGMSGVNIGPDSTRMSESIGNLKWLVVMDPLPTATSEFWRQPGADPKNIQTEVFFFPCTHWIEKDGSFVNSGRWAQWKWKVLDAPGQVKDDNWVLGQLFLRLQALYRKEGGTLPEPILNLKWAYSNPGNPSLDEIAQEINGFDLTTGKRLPGFSACKDDGTTSSGNWIYSGSYPTEGNLMQRRGTEDPTGLGYFHKWAWSWPSNRRILYNRASADAAGKPWDPTRPGIKWNGTTWVGDVPDFSPTSNPSEGKGAFIMTGEGVGRLFAPGLAEQRRPVPRALRADGVAGRQRPVGDPERPGRPPLQGRQGHVRGDRLRVPLRGHHLPGHRARALRHPARAVPGGGHARLLRRAPGRAGRGEGDHQRGQGEGPLEAG